MTININSARSAAQDIPAGSRRKAFRLFYSGKGLHGSQFQPGLPTVEGELWRSAAETGLCPPGRPPGFEMAGRTDAGVSALGQVFAVNLEVDVVEICRRLNFYLPPDIRVWAGCIAGSDFSPRSNAINRTYAYFLHSPKLDVELARKALGVLCGEHDFQNLCKKGRGRPTKACIDVAEINGTSPVYRLRFIAPWFLWQQVRRMVSAIHMVGTGTMSLEWLSEMLQPEYTGQSVPPSSPDGLYLENIEYTGLKWELDLRAIEYLRGKMKDMVAESSVRVAVFEGILMDMLDSTESYNDADCK